MKKVLFFLLIFIIIIFGVLNAQIPYVLQNDATVDAQQLNQNFSYIYGLASKNQEQNSKYFPIFSNGKKIGKGYINDGGLWFNFGENFYDRLLQKNGRIRTENIYYISSDCTGKKYFESIRNIVSSTTNFYIYKISGKGGKGEIIDNGGQLFFYEANKPLSELKMSSYSTDYYSSDDNQWIHECRITNNSGYFIELKPNDPSITGIEDADYPFTNLSFEGFSF